MLECVIIERIMKLWNVVKAIWELFIYQVRFTIMSYKRTWMKSWHKYYLVENRWYVNAIDVITIFITKGRSWCLCSEGIIMRVTSSRVIHHHSALGPSITAAHSPQPSGSFINRLIMTPCEDSWIYIPTPQHCTVIADSAGEVSPSSWQWVATIIAAVCVRAYSVYNNYRKNCSCSLLQNSPVFRETTTTMSNRILQHFWHFWLLFVMSKCLDWDMTNSDSKWTTP